MNKAQITYTWGEDAPADVRSKIEQIWQCVPKKARVTGLYFLYGDEEKSFYIPEVESSIKKGATGVRVRYEDGK